MFQTRVINVEFQLQPLGRIHALIAARPGILQPLDHPLVSTAQPPSATVSALAVRDPTKAHPVEIASTTAVLLNPTDDVRMCLLLCERLHCGILIISAFFHGMLLERFSRHQPGNLLSRNPRS